MENIRKRYEALIRLMNMDNVNNPIVRDPDKLDLIETDRLNAKCLYDLNFFEEARRVGERDKIILRQFTALSFKGLNTSVRSRYERLAREIRNSREN